VVGPPPKPPPQQAGPAASLLDCPLHCCQHLAAATPTRSDHPQDTYAEVTAGHSLLELRRTWPCDRGTTAYACQQLTANSVAIRALSTASHQILYRSAMSSIHANFKMRISVALAFLAITALCRASGVAAYSACLIGDPACGTNSIDGTYCCPNGASVSDVNGVVTCSGGTPAGCAATGQGQPQVIPCPYNMGTCSPTNTLGCQSWSFSNGAGFGGSMEGYGLATGRSCPAGTQLKVTSMTVVSTNGGNNFGVGLLDYGFRDDPQGATSSIVLLPTASTTTNCYKLTLPLQFRTTQPTWSFRCSNSGGCSGTISSTTSCEPLPTDPLCLSGATSSSSASGLYGLTDPCSSNPTRITANDQMHYCCNNTASTPTFGADGMCTCPLPAPSIDGGWSAWSTCSATCGGGTQQRSCSNPVASGGGADCTGASSQACNTNSCSDPPAGTSTGTHINSAAASHSFAATVLLLILQLLRW
jgi:hypothetical protein